MMAIALPALSPGETYVVTLLANRHSVERTPGRILHRGTFQGLIACSYSGITSSHISTTSTAALPDRLELCRYCWGKA